MKIDDERMRTVYFFIEPAFNRKASKVLACSAYQAAGATPLEIGF